MGKWELSEVGVRFRYSLEDTGNGIHLKYRIWDRQTFLKYCSWPYTINITGKLLELQNLRLNSVLRGLILWVGTSNQCFNKLALTLAPEDSEDGSN